MAAEQTLAIQAGSQYKIGTGTGLTLAFSEEFDSLPSISTSQTADAKFYAGVPWGPYGDAKFVKSQMTQRGSDLVMSLDKKSDGWNGCSIATVFPDGSGFHQARGYFEVRAKIAKGKGLWQAPQWLNSYPNPNGYWSVELDTNESYGHFPNEFRATYHLWPGSGPYRQSGFQELPHISLMSGPNIVPFNYGDAYHTYGTLIDDDWIVTFVDRIEVFRRPNFTPAFNAPLGWLCTMSLGSGWPTDETPIHSEMLIDYVRIYSRPTITTTPPPPPPTTTVEPPTLIKFTASIRTVLGSAIPGAKIALFVDGTQWGSATANTIGGWTVKIPGPVPVGSHNVVAKQTVNGVTSKPSPIFSING